MGRAETPALSLLTKPLRYKKPEPRNIQGTCVLCGVNKQRYGGNGSFRPICKGCHARRNDRRDWNQSKKRRYAKFGKKESCEECGFLAAHPCQLDIDHVDGNHGNNDPENLRTLCANCHRLKTYIYEDWKK